MRILILFFLITLPLRAAADADCSVIEALERVQFAQMRLAQEPQIYAASVDARLIISEMGRLDGTKVRLTAGSILSTLDKSRIMAFFNHSETLRLTLLATHVDQSYNILHAPSFAQHVNNLKRILPRFNCNTLTGVRGTDGLEKVSSTLAQVKTAQKLKFVKSGLWIFVVVGAIFAAFKLKSSMSSREARNKRRAKRYHVHIVTKFRNRGVSHTGTVLDISCTGVKVQTTLFKAHRIGDYIDIWIEQKWKTGQISWANSHYLGVQFDQPLEHDYVMLLNASEQQSIRKNKNGARLGAAFNSQR